MSHLSSSDEDNAPVNAEQLEKFQSLIYKLKGRNKKSVLPAKIQGIRKSLANSGGIFLGQGYHFDVVRPGAAIYGLHTHQLAGHYVSNSVSLYAPIIHLQNVAKGERVGYNGSFIASRDMRIATIPVGYADGYMRAFSSRSRVYIDNMPAEVIGRVSMDLLSIDITNIDPAKTTIGSPVEVMGKNQTPDNLAEIAGTIGYEIITSLGTRYKRVYS
jgi:alanine racemase